MKFTLAAFAIMLAGTTLAQQPDHDYWGPMANLIGGVWKSEGNWSNGQPYKQDIRVEWALNKTLMKVHTYGFVDPQHQEFGLRNEGIRQWDATASTIRFWEFDVMGGLTEGTVYFEGNNIFYTYLYQTSSGPMQITDGWIFESENRYQFKVGVYEAGEWKQEMLSIHFNRTTE